MSRGDDTQPLELSAPATARAPAFDGYPDHLRSDPVRRKVVDRLALVGRRHARHLADLHGTPTQPGPHVVVFFYRQPTAGTDHVPIASRMFLDGPDVTDLPTVLRTLRQRAREYLATGRFDPRRHMTDRAEPMTAASTYLGVGTSTLDPAPPEGPDFPWQGLAHLRDGTRLTMRSQAADLRPMSVTSTHTLDTGAGLTLDTRYAWRWASREQHNPHLDQARDALDQLHTLLAATDTPTPAPPTGMTTRSRGAPPQPGRGARHRRAAPLAAYRTYVRLGGSVPPGRRVMSQDMGDESVSGHR